jgi:hypothetical protein
MHGNLRVVSTGLNAEVAIGSLRVELLGREVRQSLQRIGLPVSESEAILSLLAEQRRTKPEGDGKTCWGKADGLSGVVRRCPVRTRGRPNFAGAEALCHACGGDGPVFEELHQLLPRVGDHVKGGEVQSILDRGEDARLLLAVEGIGTRAWPLSCRSGLLVERKSAGSTCGQSG